MDGNWMESICGFVAEVHKVCEQIDKFEQNALKRNKLLYNKIQRLNKQKKTNDIICLLEEAEVLLKRPSESLRINHTTNESVAVEQFPIHDGTRKTLLKNEENNEETIKSGSSSKPTRKAFLEAVVKNQGSLIKYKGKMRRPSGDEEIDVSKIRSKRILMESHRSETRRLKKIKTVTGTVTDSDEPIGKLEVDTQQENDKIGLEPVVLLSRLPDTHEHGESVNINSFTETKNGACCLEILESENHNSILMKNQTTVNSVQNHSLVVGTLLEKADTEQKGKENELKENRKRSRTVFEQEKESEDEKANNKNSPTLKEPKICLERLKLQTSPRAETKFGGSSDNAVSSETAEPEVTRSHRTRTKVIKKGMPEETAEEQICSTTTVEPQRPLRSRTKRLAKSVLAEDNSVVTISTDLEVERPQRKRTKVIKKAEPEEMPIDNVSALCPENQKSHRTRSKMCKTVEIYNETVNVELSEVDKSRRTRSKVAKKPECLENINLQPEEAKIPHSEVEIIDDSNNKGNAHVDCNDEVLDKMEVIKSNQEIKEKEPIMTEKSNKLDIGPFITTFGTTPRQALVPPRALTRTKVLEMARKIEAAPLKQNQTPQDKNHREILEGKENTKSKNTVPEKFFKGSPLATRNRLPVPVPMQRLNDLKPKLAVKVPADELQKRKEEEQLRKLKKEEEALKKREERMKATKETTRRKREEKFQKAAATREAVEREKMELLAKMEKEREEKEAAIRAEKLKQQEEWTKKRLINLTKAQEAEERRLKEENARLARIKEQEEEQQRLRELRIKQQEQAEKLFLQRQTEEARLAELQKKKMMTAAKMKLKVANDAGYAITPPKNERIPKPLKNADDYGIEDIDPDDSSEDENNPKKIIPLWARRKSDRKLRAVIQSYIPHDLVSKFIFCDKQTPTISHLFGTMPGYNNTVRLRTSSAIWRDTS